MIRKANGFAIVDLMFVCGIIGVLSAIALPRMLSAKQAAGASSAVASMRTINSAELTFALTCGSGFYAPDLTTLGRAPVGSNEPFIGSGLGSANVVNRSGYQIQVAAVGYAGAPPSCNALAAGEGAQGFTAFADPLVADNPRFFATNANSQIYEHSATLIGAMPEIGEPLIGHPLR